MINFASFRVALSVLFFASALGLAATSAAAGIRRECGDRYDRQTNGSANGMTWRNSCSVPHPEGGSRPPLRAPAPAPAAAPAPATCQRARPAKRHAGDRSKPVHCQESAGAFSPIRQVVWVNTKSHIYHYAGAPQLRHDEAGPICAKPTPTPRATEPPGAMSVSRSSSRKLVGPGRRTRFAQVGERDLNPVSRRAQAEVDAASCSASIFVAFGAGNLEWVCRLMPFRTIGTHLRKLRKWRSYVLIVALAYILTLAFGTLPRAVRTNLENLVFDQYQRWKPRPYDFDQPVRIVDIDDRSVHLDSRWPWPRKTMALLVEALAKANVAAVGFDVLFSEGSAER